MKKFINPYLFVLLILLVGCNNSEEKPDTPENIPTKLEIVTNYGAMQIELFDETPLHRDNFINLARNHAYDSILFHRVINNFMIQAGDPDSKSVQAGDTLGDGDVPYMIKAEFEPHLFHKKGVLGAARDNNPAKSSSGMQFYIVQGKVFNDSLLDNTETYLNKNKAVEYYQNDLDKTGLLDALDKAMDDRDMERYNSLRDSVYSFAVKDKNFEPYKIPNDQREVYKTIGGTPHLDQNYTVFGEVTNGLEVIDSIAKTKTNLLDRPLEDIRIIKINILD